MRQATPPGWAERLLARSLPADVRGRSMLGDLREAFGERYPASGIRASVWYSWQAVGLAARYAPTKVRRSRIVTEHTAALRAVVLERMIGRAVPRSSLPCSKRKVLSPMEHLLRETRLAVRRLLRMPGFTAVAVLTLGLGIGSTTAIYAVLENVVLDPLPYPQPNRLVRLTNPVPGVAPDAVWAVSPAEYLYLSEHARSLDEIGMYQTGGVNVRGSGRGSACAEGGGDPECAAAARCTCRHRSCV